MAEYGKEYHSDACSRSIMKRYYTDPDFREKVKLAAKQRRALKRTSLGKVEVTHVRWTFMVEVTYDNKCALCGGDFTDDNPATQDHIVAISMGGPHCMTNLQPAHRSCNSSRGNRTSS